MNKPFRQCRVMNYLQKNKFIPHILLFVSLLTFFFSRNQLQVSRHTTSTIIDDGRPIMYTFYEKVPIGEDDLLETWKEEWAKAGFEAKVLKLDDAKMHPYYEVMEKVVEPIFRSNRYSGRYNTMCFYRWLAMAASGGGWMCDYDTFPTNFPIEKGKNLPNGGIFTSFDGHVPCLMAGNATEWTRVAKLLVKAIPRIPELMKSDMHAFQVLMLERTHDLKFLNLGVSHGFPYKKVLNAESLREVDCDAMSKGIAIHFAHSHVRRSYKEGMFPIQNVTEVDRLFSLRGKAARVFMADWKEQCVGSEV